MVRFASDKWESLSPEAGKQKLLWMTGEIGEVIDVLLCYGISEDELKQAYISKFERNMKRW